MNGTLFRALIVLAVLAMTPRPAHAYLDPSTGSMLLSALISLIVTVGLALQAYSHRLFGMMRRAFGPTRESTSLETERAEAEPASEEFP